ncbi:MAG: hypothetical protein OQL20_03480, partial [Sedimenticola sp.]|nr:hypothetical protein [Sedimenticola sp.]
MIKRTFLLFTVSFSVSCMVIGHAQADIDPPMISDSYQKFEVSWSNSEGRRMGRSIIAIDPNNSETEGKIWFPMKGTCTFGKWGSVEPG